MGSHSSKYTPPFTDEIMRTLAIVPKVTSVPSIIGSSFIIQDVLRNKKRRGQVYHRLMVGMSTMDLLWAIRCFLSTWPVPKEFNPVIPYASGTNATCSFIGFLGHASGLASVLYTGALTLYFLLVVKYGMPEDRIRRYFEPWFHGIPNAVGWGLGIASIPLGLYKPIPWTCYIQSVPYACKKAVKFASVDPSTCEQPNSGAAGAYRWGFFFAWIWAMFVFLSGAMFMMYWGLKKTETKSSKHLFTSSRDCTSMTSSNPVVRSGAEDVGRGSTRSNFSSSDLMTMNSPYPRRPKKKNSRKFATQAALYVTFFMITWIFPTIQGSINAFAKTGYSYLVVLTTIFPPLQGFFNTLIYIRPRYLRSCKENPDKAIGQRLKAALTTISSRCCQAKGEKGVEESIEVVVEEEQ